MFKMIARQIIAALVLSASRAARFLNCNSVARDQTLGPENQVLHEELHHP